MLNFGYLAAAAAGSAREAGYGEDDACDEHPDGFVSRGAGEEFGNVGTERVDGAETEYDENDSANEQGDGYDAVHNFFLLIVCYDPV